VPRPHPTTGSHRSASLVANSCAIGIDRVVGKADFRSRIGNRRAHGRG
jgi:hypothetical protein